MNSRRVVCIAVAAALAASLSSCGVKKVVGSVGVAAYHAYDLPAKLPKNPANVRVKVSLSKQRTYVVEGNEVLMTMPVSVGTPSNPTPVGTFRVTNKEAKRRAHTHGYAYKGNEVRQTYLAKKPSGWSFKGTPMPYWVEFKSAYGFHTGWVKHQPCTHGCIRMHENLAPKFFRLVSVGTPVSIAQSQPEDATHGTIQLPPDAGPLPEYDVMQMYVGDGYFSRHKTPHFN
jgi:hypothetical protein